jgi:hypothetical protein
MLYPAAPPDIQAPRVTSGPGHSPGRIWDAPAQQLAQLESSIAALEGQRAVLGDAVVAAAVAATGHLWRQRGSWALSHPI